MTLREKAELAEKAARTSGKMLMEHPRAAAKVKATNDFVTEMDLKSEELIRSILLTACPEDEFFGEESGGSKNSAGRWIVDPIDGTSNYFKGENYFTISIAYELEGELVVGCVFCPPTDEMWIAVKGEGATKNGAAIYVSSEDDLRRSFLHLAFGHRIPDLNRYVMQILPEISRSCSDMMRLGSCAYDLCCVASGRCEAYFEAGLHIYDYAAGIVILREAGGIVTGWREGENPVTSGSILASNRLIHEKLRSLILKGDQSLLPETE